MQKEYLWANIQTLPISWHQHFLLIHLVEQFDDLLHVRFVTARHLKLLTLIVVQLDGLYVAVQHFYYGLQIVVRHQGKPLPLCFFLLSRRNVSFKILQCIKGDLVDFVIQVYVEIARVSEQRKFLILNHGGLKEGETFDYFLFQVFKLLDWLWTWWHI